MNLYYHAYIPGFPLSEYVKYIWIAKGPALVVKTKILPDDNPTLIFNLSKPCSIFIEEFDKKTKLVNCQSWIRGIQHHYIVARSCSDIDLIGIAFKPGGIYALFGIHALEFTDQHIEADLISSKMIDETLEQLNEVSASSKRIKVIEKTLGQYLSFRNRPIHSNIKRLCHEYCDDQLTIDDLIEQTGYTQKHTIALFKEYAGTSPKKYYRLDRFRKLLEEIGNSNRLKYAELSSKFGFYDQAHLIHEFRKLSGITPRQYFFKKKLTESLCSVE